MVKVKEDMTGWIMSEHGVPDSRLTVIKQTEDYVTPNGKHYAQWICECSCEKHNKINVISTHLKNGHTQSCGCLHKEIVQETNKKKHKENKYDLSNDYGIIWSHNTNQEIYFDLDRANEVLQYGWSIGINGYPVAKIDNTLVTMHMFLGYKHHDHHNRNKLDNRKENLVKCTQQENSCNRSLASNKTSNVTGVSWHKNAHRWIARIRYNGENIYLGSFINKKDAIIARLEAEKQYFKEFAPQKNLYEKYNITIQND